MEQFFYFKMKENRKRLKLSQVQLADIIGVTRRTIIRYATGEKEPSLEIRKQLCSILEIDVSEERKEMSFSNYLKAIRSNHQMTQQDLAILLGISKMAVSRYENGSRFPSEKIIKNTTSLLDGLKSDVNDVLQEQDIFPIIDKKMFGKRINVIRKGRKESLQSFGQCFTNPVGKNVVSRWEKGQNIPDVEKLMNVAYLGETTVPAILYGDEYKKFLLVECEEFNNFSKLDSRSMGLRLRKIRKDYQVEREEFGKKFLPVVNKSSMDRYENGRDIPNTERLVQYAFLGKVSLQFLIYGIG